MREWKLERRERVERTVARARRACVHSVFGTLSIGALSIAVAGCGGMRSDDAARGEASDAQAIVESTKIASKPDPRSHERYSHEDVLSMLRVDDAVVPEKPPVHPVHTVYNREAVIPPMCYTRTEGRHNPCYVCHQGRVPERPN